MNLLHTFLPTVGMTIAMLSPAQGLQADLTKPLTYRTVAIPVSQALSDLSKAAGTRLVAAQPPR